MADIKLHGYTDVFGAQYNITGNFLECYLCGAAVVDTGRHIEFHNNLVGVATWIQEAHKALKKFRILPS